MIEVRDLVYEYPTKRALEGVSLNVPAQTIVALVGPNGAGKTTLLRCLAALEPPYSGAVTIDGLDTREHPREIHARLGYLPDFYGLYDELTVRRCLTYAAWSHGLSAEAVDAAVTKAAARVGLSDRLESKAGELSRGLRQRLGIGQAIVHEPKVLLLDEPAAGLDPQARRDLSGLLTSLRDAGMTLEQRRGNLFFQRADLPAHRRLAQGKHLARMGETSRRRHGVEDAKLVPIHNNPSRPCRRSVGNGANNPLCGEWQLSSV